MTNEWTKEIETLRARVAALEAACKSVAASAPKPKYDNPEDAHEGGRDDDAVSAAWMDLASWNTAAPARDALRGGTSALDAVVSAAVAARVAAIRARVEALALARCWPAVEGCHGTLMQRDDALRATEGGAP